MHEVASSVYKDVMEKLCNCRFGAQTKNYAKQEMLRGRGKLGFQKGLLALS